jgi:hypothetical protein
MQSSTATTSMSSKALESISYLPLLVLGYSRIVSSSLDIPRAVAWGGTRGIKVVRSAVLATISIHS